MAGKSRAAEPAGPGQRAGLSGEQAEVTDEPAEVISRAAAIDVAKGSGMVCTRVPHDASPHRRIQRVWQVSARYADVVALMDELVSAGIQRLVIESTSDYWRIWYYLAEAAGLQVWLASARDARHLPGRPKTGKLDCVWLCKLNERGMLRRSFVPPEAIRDLRALTRLRSRLAADSARHQNRIEKILEDALLKISAVISDLMGQSGRRFLAALVAGQRDPKTLAALGDRRLKASTAQLEAALTGRFRDIHALEIGMLLELTGGLAAQITRLDEKVTAALAAIPGIASACTGCGEIGGTHAPGCADAGNPVLPVIERLDEITGIAADGAQILIAELGTDMTVFPTPGHAAAWAKLTSRTIQSGATSRNGRTGKGNPCLRAVLGRAAMAAAKTDGYLGERYRRIARRRGKQKAIVAVARTICEIACMIIAGPSVRFRELGPDYYTRLDAGRQTRNRIRELERLNPGMKVTLTPATQAA
jgi:transposase